jgi:phosphoribosylglycinamide formyltransferase-1
MKAILKSLKKDKIPANPVVVISNKPMAIGLEIAQKMGVRTEVIDSQGIKGQSWEYDKKIVTVLEKYNVTPENGLICLAGFMRIISPEFVNLYKDRIMNIHPALLPSFPGIRAQQQAVEYGVKYSGCTVHFVDVGVDTGSIILQSVVKVKDNDTEKTLSERILREEHKIYPKAIRLFCENKIRIKDRKTFHV